VGNCRRELRHEMDGQWWKDFVS
jgi:hypothetical protein